MRRPVLTPKPSPLQEMIQVEIKGRLLAAIKSEMSKPEHERVWTPGGFKPSEIAVEVSRQAAPELMAALFGGIVQMAVQESKNAIANMANQYR